MEPKTINLEVVYASRDSQKLIKFKMPSGCTIEAAIKFSGILELFPEIDLAKQVVGVFGKQITLDSVPQDGDRIELYRKLHLDPKQIRRLKAAKQLKSKR